MKRNLPFKTLLTAASFIVMQTVLPLDAYAANPFADVPAGHWAYESINKLAAAGVVEGYGDGSFRGDRLMTRYEMAQIVAKAMAQGPTLTGWLPNLRKSWMRWMCAWLRWRKNPIM